MGTECKIAEVVKAVYENLDLVFNSGVSSTRNTVEAIDQRLTETVFRVIDHTGHRVLVTVSEEKCIQGTPVH